MVYRAANTDKKNYVTELEVTSVRDIVHSIYLDSINMIMDLKKRVNRKGHWKEIWKAGTRYLTFWGFILDCVAILIFFDRFVVLLSYTNVRLFPELKLKIWVIIPSHKLKVCGGLFPRYQWHHGIYFVILVNDFYGCIISHTRIKQYEYQ